MRTWRALHENIIDFEVYFKYNECRKQMIKTNLAMTVDAASDPGAAYDTNMKYLLGR